MRPDVADVVHGRAIADLLSPCPPSPLHEETTP